MRKKMAIYWTQNLMNKIDALHEEALLWNDAYDSNLPAIATISGLWALSGINTRHNALIWAHSVALKMNAEYDDFIIEQRES